MISSDIKKVWQDAVESAGQVTILTGAGISAESGIPTFRGPEGYWTIGSKEYHPQEMATMAMFLQRPLEVWKWYCYRRSVCLNAEPNQGHQALVDLEHKLGDQFTLITQNVDGIHLKAGNSDARTYQIHGNVNFMRCSVECSQDLYPFPEFIPFKPVTKDFPESLLQKLSCPKCGNRSRPHVLWFDEYYNEHFYRFESSLEVAARTDLLLVIGTAGATNLPNHVVQLVIRNGGLVFDVNIEDNSFGELAKQNKGYALTGTAREILPELVSFL